MRRVLPLAYASAAACILVYTLTPWGVTGTVRGAWGWAPRFGPAFPVLYLGTAGWIFVALLNWPRLFAAAVALERTANE